MDLKEQLIQKLFDNQCTTDELNLLFELIQKEGAETAPAIMMTLLQQMGKVPNLDTATRDKIFDKVVNQTANLDAKPKSRVLPLTSSKRYFWIGSVAAAILFLVVAGWFSFQQMTPSALIAQTDFDERKEIILPDGSTVTLNGNSTLQYFADWSEGETRVVKLQGEAYFEVDNREETR